VQHQTKKLFRGGFDCRIERGSRRRDDTEAGNLSDSSFLIFAYFDQLANIAGTRAHGQAVFLDRGACGNWIKNARNVKGCAAEQRCPAGLRKGPTAWTSARIHTAIVGVSERIFADSRDEENVWCVSMTPRGRPVVPEV